MANDLILRIDEGYFNSLNEALPFDAEYWDLISVVKKSSSDEWVAIQKQINEHSKQMSELYKQRDKLTDERKETT